MNHIRIVWKHKNFVLHGRKYTGPIVKNETMCGAPVTDRDVSVKSARSSREKGNLQEWMDCPECAKLLESYKYSSNIVLPSSGIPLQEE